MYPSAVDAEVIPHSFAPSRSRGIGFALGVWVSLYPFADLALRPRIAAPQSDTSEVGQVSPLLAAVYAVIVLLGLFPILVAAFSFGLDFRRAKYFAGAIFLYAVSVPLSLIAVNDPSTLKYVILIDYVFVCGIFMISANLDKQEALRSFFGGVAATLCLAMIAALIDHDYSWGRLMGRTAPNYWGGVALMTIMSSIALKRWVFKIGAVGLSMFIMLAAQSRADLLALVTGLSVAAVLFARSQAGQRWNWIWLAIGVAVVLGLGLGSDYIINDILRLSDPNRGINSGLTGRTISYKEGWDLFAAHPWLGVGYRQHEQYISARWSVHNVYLAILADTGIVGLFGYLIFFIGAMSRAVFQGWVEPTGPNLAMAAFLSGFLVLGVVEPSGIHTGNTLSMFMIVLAAWAWRAEPSQVQAPLTYRSR